MQCNFIGERHSECMTRFGHVNKSGVRCVIFFFCDLVLSTLRHRRVRLRKRAFNRTSQNRIYVKISMNTRAIVATQMKTRSRTRSWRIYIYIRASYKVFYSQIRHKQQVNKLVNRHIGTIRHTTTTNMIERHCVKRGLNEEERERERGRWRDRERESWRECKNKTREKLSVIWNW